jgi:hypothetical protein
MDGSGMRVICFSSAIAAQMLSNIISIASMGVKMNKTAEQSNK